MHQIITTNIIKSIFWPFFGKTTGVENLLKKGGVIITANHSSYLDHFLVGCTVVKNTKREAYYLAKKEHFDTFWQRKWHQFLKAIPIDRETGGKKALAEAIKHLKKGHMIMIYPEGTRTLTGKMNRAKTGAARLALEAKVPIIPIGLTNTFKILPKGKLIPRLGLKSDINIGKPMYFNKYYPKRNSKKIIRTVTTLIMKEIAILAKKRYPFDEELLK